VICQDISSKLQKELETMTTESTAGPKTMTDVLGLYIKDVIRAYPPVGDVLGRSGIGCVACSVGSCLLRDVVGIHNLSGEQEQALYADIARIIFPGQTMDIPKTVRKAAPAGNRKLAPPLQDLVQEHANIKRVLAQLPTLGATLRAGLTPELRLSVAQALDFIRQYADRFHHAKEEDILFTFFDAGSDILKVMCAEHEAGRQHVRSASAALEQGDAAGIAASLTAYAALLTEHIRKEDEILYPWMNSQLTDSQVGQLFTKFREVDRQFEAGVKRQLAWAEEFVFSPILH